MEKTVVMRPLRFIWGWIYVGFTLLSALLSMWGGVSALMEGGGGFAVVPVIVGVLMLISAIGVAVRRRWGLYYTLVLLALTFALMVWQGWLVVQQGAWGSAGHITTLFLTVLVNLLFALFFFSYFLRRKALFR